MDSQLESSKTKKEKCLNITKSLRSTQNFIIKEKLESDIILQVVRSSSTSLLPEQSIAYATTIMKANRTSSQHCLPLKERPTPNSSVINPLVPFHLIPMLRKSSQQNFHNLSMVSCHSVKARSIVLRSDTHSLLNIHKFLVFQSHHNIYTESCILWLKTSLSGPVQIFIHQP